MYYSRLQSYGEFSNISLSMMFTLFPCHFPAFPQGLEITKLLTYFAVDLGQNVPIYQLIYRPTKLS
jgi:hypothetical protein